MAFVINNIKVWVCMYMWGCHNMCSYTMHSYIIDAHFTYSLYHKTVGRLGVWSIYISMGGLVGFHGCYTLTSHVYLLNFMH